jgi:hypothetical protein
MSQKTLSPLTVLFFRVLLFGLGVFLTYTFARNTFEPLWYRISGHTVEGRISGFLAGRKAPSVQREPDGVRKGKRKARRPVFVYPVMPGSVDSLEARSATAALTTISNYALHERVTVVMDKGSPEKAYIFGFQLITGSLLAMLLGLFMIRLGLLWRI